MGDTPQNTEGGKGPALPFEQTEKRPKKLGDSEISALLDKGIRDADLDRIVFEDVLDKSGQEFAAVQPVTWDELTDEELAEMKEGEAEVNRQIKREAERDKARRFLQIGIKLDSNDPESKLFRIAEQLLDVVDKIETDPSLVSQVELSTYRTGLSKYRVLLEARHKRDRAENERAIEKAQETEPARKDAENSTLSRWAKLKGWLKHVAEKGWQIFTKSFWEAVFDRVWPK